MNLCLGCRRRLRTCVCHLIKSFDTNSRFIILMHPMEYKKEKVGTGRFTHLILRNSLVFVDVGFDQNNEFQRALHDPEYESYLLYPDEASIDLSLPGAAERMGQKKKQFIVIDGTWPCAKKMMKLTTTLHNLARVSFKSQKISEFKVKHQPLPGCLSTVESVHQLIVDLNHQGIERTAGAEENLLEVFRQSIQQQIDCAQDPNAKSYRNRPFSIKTDRKISKKWSHRSPFFRLPAGE